MARPSPPSELRAAVPPALAGHGAGLARSRPASARLSDATLGLVAGGVLAGATALALWLRLTGLAGWDGTLSIDEARLALAGRGILEHGVPRLPSGWIYTRGLAASYPVAASFAALGESDFAARLPSVLAGTALVPVMYLLGRALAGRAGGLFAALFVAAYPPLVVWSRQAWFYADYVLLYAAALLFIVRAHLGGRPRDQLLAGTLVGLTFFAHELGVFLLLPLAAQVAYRLGGVGSWELGAGETAARPDTPNSQLPTPNSQSAPLGALALAAGAAGALWLLITSLRAETLVGPYGEVAEYFSPRRDTVALQFYGRMLLDGPGLVLAAALLGLPLALRERRFVVLLLWLALLPPLLHAAALIPDRPEERYGLTLVVVLVLLAAESARSWARWLARRLRAAPPVGVLAGLLLAVILAVHQDVDRALARGALPEHAGAWLASARALGIGPDDLVMSDLPTVVGWYVGDVDYWPRSRLYAKYTLETSDGRRDVHTGALLVRDVREYRRLVAESNAGRTLWVIASGRTFHWDRWVNEDLKRLLARSAGARLDLPDGGQILRIDLPR